MARSRRLLGDRADIRLGALAPAKIEGDRALLGRVLENLLLNAGTHAGNGVCVQVFADEQPGEVHIHVEDDGAGIEPEVMDHLFEPFGTGDRQRRLSGTGLGLAVARDIVVRHRGRIEVTSPCNAAGDGGARFTVCLPVSGAVDHAAAGAAEESPDP